MTFKSSGAAAVLLLTLALAPVWSRAQTLGPRPATDTARPAAASREAADTLRLVNEFEVNGLKVLVKQR
ncbi:MAG TPA: hypothetical protein VFZ44_01790, partial [Pyrinomonadaceae bacterium]